MGSYHIYHTNCVCKLCICEHSDKHMPDPNRNLEKSNPRKYIASSLTALNTNFCSSKIHQKPLRAIAEGSVCGLGALTSQFCQWTPSFCCSHLSYCYCLLCFIVVNTNKLLQTQGQMTKFNSRHSLFTYMRRFYYRGTMPLKFSVPCFVVKK